jgi:hypothetical protein
MISQVPPASALAKYLERTNKLLYGKLAELRREVTRLLTYVPRTFEHYTSHTIEHSDQIVLQISKILFAERKRKGCGSFRTKEMKEISMG